LKSVIYIFVAEMCFVFFRLAYVKTHVRCPKKLFLNATDMLLVSGNFELLKSKNDIRLFELALVFEISIFCVLTRAQSC